MVTTRHFIFFSILHAWVRENNIPKKKIEEYLKVNYPGFRFHLLIQGKMGGLSEDTYYTLLKACALKADATKKIIAKNNLLRKGKCILGDTLKYIDSKGEKATQEFYLSTFSSKIEP